MHAVKCWMHVFSLSSLINHIATVTGQKAHLLSLQQKARGQSSWSEGTICARRTRVTIRATCQLHFFSVLHLPEFGTDSKTRDFLAMLVFMVPRGLILLTLVIPWLFLCSTRRRFWSGFGHFWSDVFQQILDGLSGLFSHIRFRMNCKHFGDPLIYHLVTLSGIKLVTYFGSWRKTCKNIEIHISVTCTLCSVLISKCYWNLVLWTHFISYKIKKVLGFSIQF